MLQLMYDKSSVFFTFGVPVILIMGLGYFFSAEVESRLIVDLYSDGATTALMQETRDRLGKSGLFEVKIPDGDLENKLEWIKKNKNEILVLVRQKNDKPGYVVYYANKSNESAAVFFSLKEILSKMPGVNATSAVEGKIVSGSDRPYIYTVYPGIIGVVLLIVGLMGLGARIIEEREAGVLKKMKTVDSSPFSFLSGLLLSRILASVVMVVMMMILVFYFFHMKLSGSYALFSIVVFLGLMSFFGIGIVLSNIVHNLEQFQGIVQMIQFPLIMLGGVFFSIEMLPEWLQAVSLFSPLTAFFVLFNKLLVSNIGFSEILQYYKELSVLGVWGLGSFSYGMMRFRWE